MHFISKGLCVTHNYGREIYFLLDDERVAGISFQTKQELPAICVLGFRPRFRLGIGRTVSRFKLVNAVMELSMLLGSSAAGGFPAVVVLLLFTFQTVGARNSQPPFQDGSRILGGRPLRRLRMGSPVAVNKIVAEGSGVR